MDREENIPSSTSWCSLLVVSNIVDHGHILESRGEIFRIPFGDLFKNCFLDF
jgi:hypothetical protein